LAHSVEAGSLNSLLSGQAKSGDYFYLNQYFGDGVNGGYSGVEALAVAAENYIYAKDHGEGQRIGHLTYGYDNTSKLRSFDPSRQFKNVSSVNFLATRVGASGNGSGNGVVAGEFYGTTSDGIIIRKDYYQQK
jgi:hypothetical protein